MPEIILLAGPNGAGKTSFAQKLLSLPQVDHVFLNADEIARALRTPALTGRQLDSRAGRVLLELLRENSIAGRNILLETTLSGRSYIPQLPKWRALGYIIKMHYLRLPSAQASIDRVAKRVAAGGHDIEKEALQRRYDRSLMHATIFRTLVDEFYLFESLEGSFELTEAWSRDDYER
jgi:predicted ABC-type ATPase